MTQEVSDVQAWRAKSPRFNPQDFQSKIRKWKIMWNIKDGSPGGPLPVWVDWLPVFNVYWLVCKLHSVGRNPFHMAWAKNFLSTKRAWRLCNHWELWGLWDQGQLQGRERNSCDAYPVKQATVHTSVALRTLKTSVHLGGGGREHSTYATTCTPAIMFYCKRVIFNCKTTQGGIRCPDSPWEKWRLMSDSTYL